MTTGSNWRPSACQADVMATIPDLLDVEFQYAANSGAGTVNHVEEEEEAHRPGVTHATLKLHSHSASIHYAIACPLVNCRLWQRPT